MNMLGKVSLVCVFGAVAGLGFKTALESIAPKQQTPAQTVVTGEICSVNNSKNITAQTPTSPVATPVAAAPVVPVEQSLDDGEEVVIEKPMRHHRAEKLVSTVDVAKALSVAGLGKIGFGDGFPTATVSVTDDDGVTSHDYTFGFEGTGAICDENSPVCTTMDTIPAEEKAKLTTTICERAKGSGGEGFYQQVCTPKP